MRIFTFFHVHQRGQLPNLKRASTNGAGQRLRVVPATAGLGHSCDYLHLLAGERYPVTVAGEPGWWACLQGGLRVLDGDSERAVLACGDIHTPDAHRIVELQAVVDSVLVRAIPQPAEAVPADAGVAEFITIDTGEAEWAQQLHARGLVWGLCHRGVLSLQWRSGGCPDEARSTYLQPGMAFAPAPDDDFCIDAMPSGAGLLCCMQPAPEPPGANVPKDERKAA
jgi:hypothetical protein